MEYFDISEEDYLNELIKQKQKHIEKLKEENIRYQKALRNFLNR